MKVAIVGGGLAGLTAATKLARRGVDVTLHESGEQLGGRAASDAIDGAWVNRGPHALYKADGLRILRELGVRPRGTAPDLANYQFLLDDRLAPAPTSAWNTARARYLTWGDRVDIAKLYAAIFRLPASEWDHRSFAELHAQFDGSPHVQSILRWIAMLSTYGNSMRTSAGVVLRQAKASFSGVIYVTGGFQAIVDGLAERARAHGAEVMLNSPVTSLDALDVDAIVLATPPKVVERLTVTSFAGVATRMASLDLVFPASSTPPRPCFDIDRGVYLAVFPDGVVHCAKYLDPDEPYDKTAVRADIEHVLDVALPAWRAEASAQRYFPKIAVNHWFPDFESGGVLGRPDVQLDARTYLAGDWVGSEGMLADAAIASGARAADLILSQHTRAAA